MRQAIDQAGIEIQSAELAMIAANEVTLDLSGARKVMKLVTVLEEHDDVDAVYTNSDIPDDVLARLTNE